MGGFSLKMRAVRGILDDIVEECTSRGLHVKVISFDGQFLEFATTDADGLPLTICNLQKEIWKEAREISKKDILQFLLSMNDFPSITSIDDLLNHCYVEKSDEGIVSIRRIVYAQKNVGQLLKKQGPLPRTDPLECEEADLILQHLPDKLVQLLDSECLQLIQSASAKLLDNQPTSDLSAGPASLTTHDDKPTVRSLCWKEQNETSSSWCAGNHGIADNCKILQYPS